MIKKIAIIALILPFFVVFRSLFSPGPLAWGDAPHFYAEGAMELFGEPFAWSERGVALGGVNPYQWLSPILFFWGALAKVGLGNDLIIRLLFYFPAVLLALVGPYFFVRYLKGTKTVGYFASLFYVFNTYFILLIDGGVVGLALAYGFFPVGLLFLRKYFDTPSRNNFWAALTCWFGLTVFDPRVSVICTLTLFVWVIGEALLEKRVGDLGKLIYLIPLGVLLLLISMYWLIPLFLLDGKGLNYEITALAKVRWQNVFTLFSPHWPGNIFGKTSLPGWQYYLFPLILVVGSLLGKSWKHLLIIAVFGITATGVLPLDKIIYGTAFRDSTKFFIPMILSSGILIGQAVQNFKSKSWVIGACIYIYLLVLVSPALTGKMNFVLSNRNVQGQLSKINDLVNLSPGSFRVAFLPEKHPLAFETRAKPALSGKDLVSFRPLARLNGGTYDLFNYINNSDFLEWYKIFGIKYLVMTGDPRVIALDAEGVKNWEDLKNKFTSLGGLTRVEKVGDIEVYENKEVRPRVYSVNKLIGVVGPEVGSSSLSFTPAIYFEDGKLNPYYLEGLPKDSLAIVLNGKERTDLQMSFLQKHFLGLDSLKETQWAKYTNEDYLLYKYQLTIRGLTFNDFDYQKGISFSSEDNEKMTYGLEVKQSGEYFLAVRGMSKKGSKPVKLILDAKNDKFLLPEEKLGWYTTKIDLTSGRHELTILNEGGLQVINTVALVPLEDWNKALSLSESFLNHFSVIDNINGIDSADYSWKPVDFEDQGTSGIKINNLESSNWIVLNSSFHPQWGLKKGYLSDKPVSAALPLYSSVNVFYNNPEWQEVQIAFGGQRVIRWGMYFSLLSFLILGIFYLWSRANNPNENSK